MLSVESLTLWTISCTCSTFSSSWYRCPWENCISRFRFTPLLKQLMFVLFSGAKIVNWLASQSLPEKSAEKIAWRLAGWNKHRDFQKITRFFKSSWVCRLASGLFKANSALIFLKILPADLYEIYAFFVLIRLPI